MDRSNWPRMYVSTILAVLFCDCAYTLLNPEDPIERVRHIVQLSQMRIVCVPLAEQGTRQLQEIGLLPLDMGVIANQDQAFSIRMTMKHNVHADSLAYVCFTSGSTGKPKGVMVEHISVNRLVLSTTFGIGAWQRFDESTVFLHHSNPSFDASVLEIYAPLLNQGICVIFCNDILNFDKLKICLTENKVSDLFLTTRVFDLIGEQRIDVLMSVSHIYFGGEQVSIKHVNNVMQHLGETTDVYHVYGPTENTTFSTAVKLCLPFDQPIIGTCIPNTTCYVVDDTLNILDFDQPGELLLGGIGVARGYIGNPVLTKQRFISNPWGAGKLYLSGDIVKMLPNYMIHYIGRQDDEVKRNGMRIDLSNLAFLLIKDTCVSNAFVTHYQVNNSTKIVAYIVSSQAVSEQACRESLLLHVSPGQIPDRFIFLSELPLNQNGKVNKSDLPNPFFEFASSDRTSQAAQNKTDHSLKTISQPRFAKVLEHICTLLKSSVVAEDLIGNICTTSIDKFKLRHSLEQHYNLSLPSYLFQAGGSFEQVLEKICTGTPKLGQSRHGSGDIYDIASRYQRGEFHLRPMRPEDKTILTPTIASNIQNGVRFMGAKYWLYDHFGDNKLFEHSQNKVLLTVEHVATCEVAGYAFVSFTPEYLNQVGWISQYIIPKWQGSGVGASLFFMLLDFGFTQLGLRKLVSTVNSVFHQDSIKLWEAVGAKQEGCFREESFLNGTFQDRFYYGIFRSEW
eukprot:CAMPEP_0183805828 /NCGR_PEP_ID=MMETSP0803_2-20130417/38115_1 /TAXON_ID=195967 /ORGANISM="Crustomastix stigmata, Strain CCMP3273" /LENGTH=732 /DNA_ID=CAMNT_0026050585 /DNA_START=271 /DNA_END=2466 /DNA_ORIENTATION=+